MQTIFLQPRWHRKALNALCTKVRVKLSFSAVSCALMAEHGGQESSTLERLKQEHHVLSGTVSYLRAKLALQGAFASDPDSSTGSEPPGSGEAPSGGGGEAP